VLATRPAPTTGAPVKRDLQAEHFTIRETARLAALQDTPRPRVISGIPSTLTISIRRLSPTKATASPPSARTQMRAAALSVGATFAGRPRPRCAGRTSAYICYGC